MSAAARRADEARWAGDEELFAAPEPPAHGEQPDVDEPDEDEVDEVEQPADDVVNQAADFARAGLRVFPVLRSADKSKDKQPPPGFLWKDRSSHRISDVVQEFTAAVAAHGEDFIAVAWALGLDGYCTVDDDVGLPAELGELLDTRHAVNVTRRGCHRIWRQPAGFAPGNSTARFPVQGWGEFRGVGGYIVLTGADRPGFDVEQLVDVAEFPRPDWLTPAGESVGMATGEQVRAFLGEHTGNARPGAVEAVARALDGRNGARHPSLVTAMPWALRDARAGLYPATTAVERLHGWWRQVMDDPGRRDGPEFAAVLSWAVAAALTDDDAQIAARRSRTTRQAPPHVDPDTGEILAPNLPDDFWMARPVLAQIRQAAHSRLLPADAVLGAVLARVAMLVPPNVALPAIVGAPGSLDVLIALIGPPGAGKSSSAATARELLPTSRRDVIDGLPIGTGEGIAESYLGPPEQVTDPDGTTRKVRRQTITAVLAFVDEGEALAEMASRKGSTLLPTLRTAWSGGTLGQANASADTYRLVRQGRYRLAAVIAWQPVHAAVILDDTGGTPERIVWLSAVDPTIPDASPHWPGPLDWTPPATIGAGVTVDVDKAVSSELRAAHLARARGESTSSGDGHEGLSRLKLAALLGQLDGRDQIAVDDWALAGQIMASSARVRSSVVSVARTAAFVREQTATERAVRREHALADSAEARALERAARAVGRYAHRHGVDNPVTRRQLTRAVAGRDAALVDAEAVLTEAGVRGWIIAVEDGYRPGGARPA